MVLMVLSTNQSCTDPVGTTLRHPLHQGAVPTRGITRFHVIQSRIPGALIIGTLGYVVVTVPGQRGSSSSVLLITLLEMVLPYLFVVREGW